jgi:hypothetical protein
MAMYIAETAVPRAQKYVDERFPRASRAQRRELVTTLSKLVSADRDDLVGLRARWANTFEMGDGEDYDRASLMSDSPLMPLRNTVLRWNELVRNAQQPDLQFDIKEGLALSRPIKTLKAVVQGFPGDVEGKVNLGQFRETFWEK